MSTRTVLVVDDDRQLLRALEIALRGKGFRVLTAGTGPLALDVARSQAPDLVLLDLGLPGMEGNDVIRGLRGWTDIPIIVMSGRRTSADKVEALDLGADDYVVKPFGLDELLARMRAHWRRQGGTEQVTLGEAVVDLGARRVLRGGEEVRLTPTEWHVLERLVTHPERLMTPAELLAGLRTGPADPHGSYLRVYVSHLRRKLEPDPARPRHLVTEPGLGYRFHP